jgi:hypothetical protein
MFGNTPGEHHVSHRFDDAEAVDARHTDDHHIGRAGDEVGLQQPIDRSLGDKVLSLVGEAHRQLLRRQLW